MKEKNQAERNGCSEDLLGIYQDKINDLLREKNNANRLMDQYYHTVLRDDNVVEEDNTESSVAMLE